MVAEAEPTAGPPKKAGMGREMEFGAVSGRQAGQADCGQRCGQRVGSVLAACWQR